MHKNTATLARGRQSLATLVTATLVISGTVVLTALSAAPASAAVLGSITVTPTSGDDATLFGGEVANAQCPAGTADSYFSIDGSDLPANQAILGPGNATGTGAQSFSGASIANLKSANSGSFATSGTYTIRFNCVRGSDGLVSDTYNTTLNYTAGGSGAYATATGAPVPTFRFGTNVIAAGQFTKVVITGTPGDTIQILVKGAASSTYTVIATRIPNNSAGITYVNVSPSTTSSYYVRNAAGAAPPKSLLVKAVQSLVAQASGQTGIFTGHVAPSLVGRTVSVYYYVTGGNVMLAGVTKTVQGGQFRVSRRFAPGQKIHVFAQTNADKYNAAGRSPVVQLTLAG